MISREQCRVYHPRRDSQPRDAWPRRSPHRSPSCRRRWPRRAAAGSAVDHAGLLPGTAGQPVAWRLWPPVPAAGSQPGRQPAF